jgi:hypothetical protein
MKFQSLTDLSRRCENLELVKYGKVEVKKESSRASFGVEFELKYSYSNYIYITFLKKET